MLPEEARTVYIIRRMKRKSLGLFTLRPYDPAKASPEELRFDVLDEREKRVGQLAYDRLGIRLLKTEDTVLNTPWGEGRIQMSNEGTRIFVKGRELFMMKGSILRKGFQLVSPTGAELVFHQLKRGVNDIEFSDGNGYVAVVEEKGELAAPAPGHELQPTRQEIMAMPKADRPRSVESLVYVQYRIKMAGALPVPQDDAVAALAIFASFGCLMGEIQT